MWARALLLLLIAVIGGATGWVTPAWAEGATGTVTTPGNESASVSPEIIQKLEVAADEGNAEAQVNLGKAYYSGLGGLTKDDTKAVEWWQKAADQRNAEAQYYLAQAYDIGLGGLPKDGAKAVEWLQKAAAQGIAEAQLELGAVYADGQRGLSKDYTKAVEWWRKAAERGNAAAQRVLGAAYELGRGGLPKNDAKAVEWLLKAAAQGEAKAQTYIGSKYYHGQLGLPKDDTKAVGWWRAAAEQGHAEAQFNLGLAYEKGVGGLPKDDAKAVEWWRKAAAQEETNARMGLARLYYQGRFSPANHEEAQAVEAWYSREVKHSLSTVRQTVQGMLIDGLFREGKFGEAEFGEAKNSDLALPLSPDSDQTGSSYHMSNGISGFIGLVALVVLTTTLLKADNIDGWVETAWLKLSYVSLPKLGRQECEAFLRFQDRWLGKSFLSWRRWVGATALCGMMIVLTYLLIEGTHFVCGTMMYPPFSAYHWDTGFPLYIIPGAISVSVTRFIINRSLHLLGNSPRSSAVFLGIIVLSTAITSWIAAASTIAMHAITIHTADIIVGSSFGWHAFAHRALLGAEDVLSQLLDWEWSDTEVFKLSALLHGICSYAPPLPVFPEELTTEQAGLRYAFSVLYGDMQSIGFIAIRIVYAIVFISWWILLSAHRGLGAFLLQVTKVKHGATFLIGGVIPAAIGIASALKSFYP